MAVCCYDPFNQIPGSTNGALSKREHDKELKDLISNGIKRLKSSKKLFLRKISSHDDVVS